MRPASRGAADSPRQPTVHFSLDERPLFASAEHGDEIVEGGRVLGRELEPREKVEFVTEIASVIQPPRDARQVLQRIGDVAGSFFEDGPPFVLRKRPPRSS